MSESLRISLIIPAFNRTENTRILMHYLTEYHQDELHEIILSDDGSSEDQEAVLREFQDDLRVRCLLIRQEDRGFRLARTRNNGVRHSTGDYICFLDQDLIPSFNYFRMIKRFARRGRFLLTRTIYTTPAEKQWIVNEKGREPLREVASRGKSYLRNTAVKDYIYHLGKKAGLGKLRPKLKGGAFSLYRDDFRRVNGFDEDFQGWGLEDDDLGRRLYLSRIIGLNISHRAWTYHLWHEETPTKNNRPNKPLSDSKKYDKNSIIPEKGLNQDDREKISVVEIN